MEARIVIARYYADDDPCFDLEVCPDFDGEDFSLFFTLDNSIHPGDPDPFEAARLSAVLVIEGIQAGTAESIYLRDGFYKQDGDRITSGDVVFDEADIGIFRCNICGSIEDEESLLDHGCPGVA